MYMKKYMNDATGCSDVYKKKIDAVHKELSLLQLKVYLMWANAEEIIEGDTDKVWKEYDRILMDQVWNSHCENFTA